ncbi:hypothetical protein ASE04_11740 [Rhizobium sp. Root708]|nr:hypothetical protein ASE04_11740 [Rhizobium sp. Root708]
MCAQEFEGLGELPWPRFAGGIIKSNDEAAAGGSFQPAFDDLPRLQIVGERYRAEIMPERSTNPGCDRKHRSDAGKNNQLDFAPLRRPRVDRLANRGCHCKHTGVSA